ncbi:MAG: hypothetical protein RAP03_02005 [Candidatus Electryonea clarkiae]|nr:hypothetical protein [Candidatus Electryonea clarkiae]
MSTETDSISLYGDRIWSALRVQQYFVRYNPSDHVVPKYRSVSLLEIQAAKPF